MKPTKIMLGLPIILSVLLSGCSSGETPSLPEKSSEPSSSASPSSGEPTNSSPEVTPVAAPKATGVATPVDESKLKVNETVTNLDGVIPLTYSTAPGTSVPPVYEAVPETKSDVRPADSNAAFDTYLSFYNALKAKDWDKACDYVELGKGKTEEFCINWYKEYKAETPDSPKIENYTITQEINSNSIIMSSKNPDDKTQNRITIKSIDGAWKVHVSPIAVAN